VLLEYNLKASGCDVQLMRRGDEAETCLNEQMPDLLILDWMLPGLSGVELLRRLRRKASTRDLPIIVLTARTDESDIIRALETGADDFVRKPFSVRELLARVEALLRRRAPSRGYRVRSRSDARPAARQDRRDGPHRHASARSVHDAPGQGSRSTKHPQRGVGTRGNHR
jgi:two-component system, OmpR family, phosphate regulon response regulator PhoB